MRRADLAVLGFLLALGLAAVLGARAADLSFLPRHPATRDLPWAARSDAAAGLPFNAALSDKINLLYPDFVVRQRALADGRLPLWNPGVLCGVSQIGNPLAGVLYPPNWALAAVDPLDGVVIEAVANLLLCVVFAYRWLRGRDRSVPGALAGAFAFALSGFVAARLQNGPLVSVLAWWPLGASAIERFLRHGRRGALVPLAVSIAMMWFAGFPTFALHGMLALLVLALFQLGQGDPARVPALRAGFAILAVGAGIALAAPALLAVAEGLADTGHHGRSLADLVSERYRSGAFLGLLFPTALGDPIAGGDWRQGFLARIVLGEGPELLPPGIANWSERTLYFGPLVLMLVLLGIRAGRRRERLADLTVIALGVGLSVSVPVIGAAMSVPGFDVSAPARAVSLLPLGVAGLAAAGLDHLLGRVRDGGGRGLALLLGALLVLPLGLAGYAFLDETGFVRGGIAALKAAGVEARLGVAPPRPVDAYVDAFRPSALDLRRDLVRLALVLGATSLVLFVGRRRARLVAFVLLAVIAGDLGSHLVRSNPLPPRAGAFASTPDLAALARLSAGARFMRVARDAAAEAADRARFFPPNLGLVFGIDDVQGWREQVPLSVIELFRGVSCEVAPVGISAIPLSAVASPVLDLARVKMLVATGRLPELESQRRWPPAEDDAAAFWIYENPGILPRAWVVHRAAVKDDAAARDAVRRGAVDPRREVLLDAWPEGQGPLPEAPAVAPPDVEIVRDAPEELVLRTELAAPGYVVVPDSFAAGWRAETLDAGRATRVPLMKAFGAFRAVPLPTGRHELRLYYAPRAIRLGVLASVAGAALLVALLVFGPRGVRGRGQTSSEVAAP